MSVDNETAGVEIRIYIYFLYMVAIKPCYMGIGQPITRGLGNNIARGLGPATSDDIYCSN